MYFSHHHTKLNKKIIEIMIEQIKGIFFDLYGTLLVFENFDKANAEWENTFFELTGKKHNLEILPLPKVV